MSPEFVNDYLTMGVWLCGVLIFLTLFVGVSVIWDKWWRGR